jgi:hypothetical protein
LLRYNRQSNGDDLTKQHLKILVNDMAKTTIKQSLKKIDITDIQEMKINETFDLFNQNGFNVEWNL